MLRRVSQVPGWVRWVVPAVIWCLAWILLQRVPTTDGPALAAWPAAYNATRLFALDAPGFPADPSPWWNAALWLAIVAAPLNTATAAADFVRRHLLSGEVMARGLTDHVVVCGLGEHGRVIAREALARGFEVVVLDRQPGNVGRTLTLESGEALVLQGDMTEPDALSAAGVERARAVFLASGLPLTNMQGARAVRALAGEGGPRVCALVDEADTLTPLLETLGLARDDLVDQFAHAARWLCKDASVRQAIERVGSGEAPARIAILGFGRFGQAVLRELLRDPALPPDLHVEVELVDRRARERAPHFQAAVDEHGWRVQAPPDGDAETWVASLQKRATDERPGMVFLCVDNDPLSLRCGARVRACDARVAVVLRIARPLRRDLDPADADGVVACSVSQLFGQTVGPLLDGA